MKSNLTGIALLGLNGLIAASNPVDSISSSITARSLLLLGKTWNGAQTAPHFHK